MNADQTLAYIAELQTKLDGIEAQMIPNLPPTVQEALDDEWDHVMSEMELLTTLLMEDVRGCATCSGCPYCEDMGMYDPSDEI
jgi:hypothetical protein